MMVPESPTAQPCEGQRSKASAVVQIDDSRDYLFTDDDRQPIDPNYVSRAFRNAVAAARIRHIPLHGLRHTHASHLIEAGVAISTVPSKRLGDANPNITLGVYTHQLRDSQAEGACAVADLVRKATDQPTILAYVGRGQTSANSWRHRKPGKCGENVVARDRIELSTPRFSVVCSTN